MVLRDSKHDKVTFDSPVSETATGNSLANIKILQVPPNINAGGNQDQQKLQQNLAETKQDETVININNDKTYEVEPGIHRGLSIDVSEPSISSDILDSSGSGHQTPEINLSETIDDSFIRNKNSPSPSRRNLDQDEQLHDLLMSDSTINIEQESESSSSSVCRERSHSREVSPMQEKILLEQNWQTNLSKIDVILSDASAFHKGHFDQEQFIEHLSQKKVLQVLFKLFDWDCKNRVSQEKLVDCARRTLLNQGGLEWVELLEVLAYVICEGDEEDVTEEAFIKIFTSKGVIEKLFKYITKDENGCVSRQKIMDLIANLTYARPRKGFTKDNLEGLEKLFRKALGTKQELSFDDFKKIVHSRNSFFAERVFEIFDRDKSGSVSLSEFLDAMHQFTGKSPNDKIQFLFRVYDLDGDGLIQREELEQVMKACMEENGMKFSHEQIEDLTLALFEDADTEQRGEITYEALKAQLEKHPGLLENLSISIDRWLVPPEPQIKHRSLLEKINGLRPYQLTLPYWKNNYVYLFFLFSYIIVNLGLFIDRGLTVYNDGGNIYYILARACGQCLNFNCSFILVLMLRQCITFLRARGASAFLPLDQHLYLHKLVGWVIFFYSFLHTVMHLINFPLNVVPNEELNPNEYTVAQFLFTDEPQLFGLIDGWANPTGFVLMVVLIVMVICSLPFVRKSGYFEVFYWTHLLYVMFWTVTILHGPHFWKWFIGPAVLFLIERLYRTIRTKTGHGKTYISSGILLPSKVIHLVIQKPYNFQYCSGDYVFVNIPTIAKYEWHPFTISSAPEQDGAIWLHIRAVGEWTNRLYKYFEAQQLQCEKRSNVKLSIRNSEVKIPMELEMVTKATMNNEEKQGIGGRKNGVINVSYDNSSSDVVMVTDIPEEHTKEELSVQTENNKNSPKKTPRNKKLNKTTSVPDMKVKIRKKQKKLNEFSRTNSESRMSQNMLDEANQLSGRQTNNENSMVFKTNRSVAKSVRYMRRKPKVVTLDMPAEDSSSEENIIDQTDSNAKDTGLAIEIEPDLEVPKNTAVLRGNGRLSQIRKISRIGSKSLKRKSRRESKTQIARRISRLKEAESFGQCTLGKPLAIYIDGPYGAPSSHIFRAQHAVLIGTGIGVTPFASILQSIMHRYLKARQMCPNCDHSWTSDIPQSVMNLRKVDFFWINRDQRSFEWFVNLLSQLEIEQAEQGSVLDRFLDMHMYITSALQRTDMKAVGLQLALELLHEKEKRDLITGLKTRTNAGRPNWDKVFKQLCSQKKGKITVFYCGPPALARTLRYKCDEYGFDFRKEIF